MQVTTLTTTSFHLDEAAGGATGFSSAMKSYVTQRPTCKVRWCQKILPKYYAKIFPKTDETYQGRLALYRGSCSMKYTKDKPTKYAMNKPKGQDHEVRHEQ